MKQARAKAGTRRPQRGRPRPPAQNRAAVHPAPAPEPEKPAVQVATGVQTVTVTPDEAGMRVDRFLEAKFPGLSFSHIQRVIRKGELRVDGRRVDGKDRLRAGSAVRIPPVRIEAKPARGTE